MVRKQLWWWLLLAAFVLAVLNLVFSGWLFVLPNRLLFFASNVLSMALSIAVVVWSILDLLASYRTGRSVHAAVYVTSWLTTASIILMACSPSPTASLN